MANCPKSAVDNTNKKDTLTNLSGIIEVKKNAATSAKVNGAKTIVAVQNQHQNCTTKTHANATSLYAKDAHTRIAKAIGYTLTLGTSKAWEGLSLILMARLSKAERAALAYSALISLDEDTAYRTASVALFGVLNGEVVQ